MKQKFQNLGFVLGRNTQKKIKGGVAEEPVGEIGGGCRTSYLSCTYYESGTGSVTGHCEENSNGSCVCNASSSSVVFAGCKN